MSVTNQGSNNKKDLNVEINLMPVFDILSVCICFLLMTVVWMQVGVVKTSQAMGDNSDVVAKEKPSVWLTINEKNDVEISLKGNHARNPSNLVRNKAGIVDWNMTEKKIKELVDKSYESAVILPSKKTKYEQVVQLMSLFKEIGVKDVGISPI